MVELNSRDKTIVGPAVLCFMEINYFAALICEVNWLFCGIVALFFTVLLVSDNFPCSCHLSQDSDESNTDHLTAQHTLPTCPEGYVFCNCRTWLSSWKYQDNIFWPSFAYKYDQSFPVLLVHVIWNLQFKFSKLYQQIWIKISYNK